MQPIVPITDEGVGNIVPTSMSPQVPIGSQLSGPGGGGQHGHGGVTNSGGMQIPTSMEQMKGQATSFLKKIAPTPPSQPPQKSGPMSTDTGFFVNTGDPEQGDNPDIIIGGKLVIVLFQIHFWLYPNASFFWVPMCKGAISDATALLSILLFCFDSPRSGEINSLAAVIEGEALKPITRRSC